MAKRKRLGKRGAAGVCFGLSDGGGSVRPGGLFKGVDVVFSAVLRLALAARPAACILFVISGFAISLRPLRLAHLGRAGESSDALS